MVQSPDEGSLPHDCEAHSGRCGRSLPWCRSESLRSAGVSGVVARPVSARAAHNSRTYLAERVGYADDGRKNLLRVSSTSTSCWEWDRSTRSYIDVFDADYAPTPVHRLLAKLPTMIRGSTPIGLLTSP